MDEYFWFYFALGLVGSLDLIGIVFDLCRNSTQDIEPIPYNFEIVDYKYCPNCGFKLYKEE